MTLNLTSDIAAGLTIIAAARGLSVEDYLRQIVEHELATARAGGMVLENGLLIYGVGTVPPTAVVDNAIRRSRDERSHHLLGRLS